MRLRCKLLAKKFQDRGSRGHSSALWVLHYRVQEALTSIIHSNWDLLKGELRQSISEILNFALTETRIRKELIEEVDLGPFKHKVDNGLSMRKAAF